jgi:RHS repeat-associated protein
MSERGQITGLVLGNGLSESTYFDESTGMPLTINAYGLSEAQPSGCTSPLLARQVNYQYDQFINVASQTKQFLQRSSGGAIQFQPSTCTPLGITAAESYQYDELQRLGQSARSWNGMPSDPLVPSVDAYAYDELGNVTKKTDYGDTYTYGDRTRPSPAFAGPHAVTTVTKSGTQKPAFGYDGNGNMTTGDGRTVQFDKLDRPTTVVANGFTTVFRYTPDGDRYLASTTGSTGQRNEYYDTAYEVVESASSPVQRTYVNNVVMVVQTGAQRAVNYRHLDRLGSLDAVTVDDGTERPADAHGYDAFGKPRARDWTWSGELMRPPDGTSSERGFTGHEHFDSLYLIHMNGRMYDYRLGRFLSVDPIISNPANSQSINPYSYIGNNPLSGVDPTGYAVETADGCKDGCKEVPTQTDSAAQANSTQGSSGTTGLSPTAPQNQGADRTGSTATTAASDAGQGWIGSLQKLAAGAAVALTEAATAARPALQLLPGGAGAGGAVVEVPAVALPGIQAAGLTIVGLTATGYLLKIADDSMWAITTIEMGARYGGGIAGLADAPARAWVLGGPRSRMAPPTTQATQERPPQSSPQRSIALHFAKNGRPSGSRRRRPTPATTALQI